MPRVLSPIGETARLDALLRVAILDTESEEFFEDIVDSVQQVVAAPIVLISFVDELRQWFKARRGLDVTETERKHSFCTHAILSDACMVVGDARLDKRFKQSPLVTGPPHFVAYAGAPIKLAGGARLGTVCAVDHAPRAWTDAQIAHLERNARLVARHLEARRAFLEQDRERFLEGALSRAESRYKSVTNSMSEGMIVVGPSGAIIDSNPAARAILGLSESELFGRFAKDPLWRGYRPDGAELPPEDFPSMVTLRTGQPQYGVLMGFESSGRERRWLTVNTIPVRRAADGRIDQVIVAFRVVPAPEGE